MDTSSMDKDQMLQEKDKQIEELTRMLRQKQQLVETLRSQLEQGKVAAGAVVKKEGKETSRPSLEVKLQPLIKASDIQPPTLTNGMVLTVKEEVEPKKEMEEVTKETGGKTPGQPMQCSQETLLRLQQIHRLQLQAEHQKQQQQRSPEAKVSSPQRQQDQKKEAQILLQQQQLQQLIIQQTQQKLSQHKRLQLNQLKQGQLEAQAQQKNQVLLKQAQNHKPTLSHNQQRKQQRTQQRQQQKQAAAGSSQPVTPCITLSHAA